MTVLVRGTGLESGAEGIAIEPDSVGTVHRRIR